MIRQDMEKALEEMGQKLSSECIQQFELFASELKKWNSKVNLTAINKDSDIAIKHIIDSLFFVSCVRAGEKVLDVGSGAGFPSIPLKIAMPDVEVVSVDSVGKKIMFQKHVARLLGFSGFEALNDRVENLHSKFAKHFDVISSRAFAKLDEFIVLAAPMLNNGGRIIAMKGPDAHAEMEHAHHALERLGFEIRSFQDYSLPMQRGERCLVTISHVKADK